MKKFIYLLTTAALLFLASSMHASPPGNPCDDPVTVVAKKDISIEVQAVYTSQIGVREATGKNDGAQVEKYLKAVNLGKGYAWCAAFVRWSFDQVHVKTTITAWSPTAHNAKNVCYFKGKLLKEPRAGDVFTIYYASMKRIGHTGFYDSRQNQSIFRSVEGNTNGEGSREGDGVYAKYRSYKSVHSITRWI
jgi:hypothetical protein